MEHDGSSTPWGGVMEDGGTIGIEAGIDETTIAQLKDMGHVVKEVGEGMYGGYQAVWSEEEPMRYFARLPTYAAESGSLSLCAASFLSLPSDPAVASNALAIRIVFPLVRVTPASFSRSGLPASLGKRKAPSDGGAFLCAHFFHT